MLENSFAACEKLKKKLPEIGALDRASLSYQLWDLAGPRDSKALSDNQKNLSGLKCLRNGMSSAKGQTVQDSAIGRNINRCLEMVFEWKFFFQDVQGCCFFPRSEVLPNMNLYLNQSTGKEKAEGMEIILSYTLFPSGSPVAVWNLWVKTDLADSLSMHILF